MAREKLMSSSGSRYLVQMKLHSLIPVQSDNFPRILQNCSSLCARLLEIICCSYTVSSVLCVYISKHSLTIFHCSSEVSLRVAVDYALRDSYLHSYIMELLFTRESGFIC